MCTRWTFTVYIYKNKSAQEFINKLMNEYINVLYYYEAIVAIEHKQVMYVCNYKWRHIIIKKHMYVCSYVHRVN